MSKTTQKDIRQRIEYRRRNLIFVVAIAVMLLLGSFVGLTTINPEATGYRLNEAEPPRNTDVWVIYPDDSARFMTLFYEAEGNSGDAMLVDVAGPLVASEGTILEENVLGGELINVDIYSAEGFINEDNTTVVYPLYQLQRTSNNAPYGVDVLAAESPYVAADPSGTNSRDRIVTMGAPPQTTFTQSIVAVAVPYDSENIVQQGTLTPYREVTIRGWRVLYYDVTETVETDSIRIAFRVPFDAPSRELTARLVDRRR